MMGSNKKCDVIIRKVVNYNIFKTLSKDSKMQDLIKNEAKTNGRWTKEEHLKFLEGLRIYGKNWKKIQQFVQTRTGSQIRSHAQKFFLKLQENGKHQNSELSANFNDFKEQAESPTVNSKTVSEPKTKHQPRSSFFNIIVEYWKNSNSLDFWTSLVDYRRVTLTDEGKSYKGSSFLPYNRSNALEICNNVEGRSQN